MRMPRSGLLQDLDKIGKTDRTMKYDVQKTDSLANPIVGILWIYDGNGNCVMKSTYHYNER